MVLKAAMNKTLIPDMNRLLFLILGIAILSSCEKETYVDYYIDNQSSTILTADGSNIIHSADIDKTVNPGERVDLANWSKRGKQTDLFEPTVIFGTDLTITNESGDTLRKDYKSISNWSSEVDEKRAVASHEYILIIKDSDF
jgi:hypothetical protein